MSVSGHILIIDDEASLRQTVARILQRTNLEVTTAASGEEGLALLSQQSFDLVYLDIRMPRMSGLDVLKTIHLEHPETPVILFTAQPDLSSAIEALRLGAIDYLLKPLQPQALIDRTQAVLAWHDKERQKREVQSKIEVLQAELRTLEDSEGEQPASTPVATGASERFVACGKLVLDLHTRRLTIGERAINLPPTTFDYLLVLARHTPNTVDYQTLVAEAQGYKAEFREARELVKWHIHHIRQAIGQDAHSSTHVINVRGIGYRLVAD
jgi:DNA-binding response OmpR family regulator